MTTTTPTRATFATRTTTPTRVRRTRSTPRASRRASTRARAVKEEDGDEDSDDSKIRVVEATVVSPDAAAADDAPTIRVDSRGSGEYERRARTEPRRFVVAEGELFNVAAASAPIALRLTSGLTCDGYKVRLVDGEVAAGTYSLWSGNGKHVEETSDVAKFPRPSAPLKIYNLHGCPFCKKVREAVISLDLDVLYYPCPRDGPEYRAFVRADGGKAQFPYLIDENTEPPTKMYESDAIIEHLYERYGPGKANIGPALSSGALTNLTAGLSLLPRLGKGSAYSPSKKPENMKPLVFWGYEGSPFCALVAEKLCELELPYLQRSVGRGSPKRQELYDKHGMFQVPFLQDPNTMIEMFESKDIVDYLQETYAA